MITRKEYTRLTDTPCTCTASIAAREMLDSLRLAYATLRPEAKLAVRNALNL